MLRFGQFGIRPFCRQDKSALVRCADDAGIAQFLGDRFPHPYTAKHADQWLDFCLGKANSEHLAITEDDRFIGGIRLERQQDIFQFSAEIGYWLGRAYWGRGIATAAVGAFIDHAFSKTDLVRIYAGVFSSNPASRRVLEKVGFRMEGIHRSAICKHGKLQDELMFALLREDWSAGCEASFEPVTAAPERD